MSQNFQTQTFTALANEDRRRIVFALVNGRLSISDLSLLLNLSVEALTPHLEMLHQLGVCSIAGKGEMFTAQLTSQSQMLKELDTVHRLMESGNESTSMDPLDEIFAA